MHLRDRVLRHIREERLISPGDRVGIAVSGGADSVALLRMLLELQAELGVVLSVVHFNHKIRGAASDADQQIVAGLAKSHSLDLHVSSGDAKAHALASGNSLETAARDLRYVYFDRLLRDGMLSSVATAHSLDDQAETVLMRLIRGSGTRGLAGIYPVLQRRHGRIVRPLLILRRGEVLAYLRSLDQAWREDASNLDLHHTRNRIRHKLLPLLEQDFNPAIVHVLAELAEIARGEEDFWARCLEPAGVITSSGANISALLGQPVALQRRLLRSAAERWGVKLDFEHVEALRRVAALPSSTLEYCEVPHARAVFSGRASDRELRFEIGSPTKRKPLSKLDYAYPLSVPGEVEVPETNTLIRASLIKRGEADSRKLLPTTVPGRKPGRDAEDAGYNQAELLDPRALASELTVRNWRPGDRYWPAHRKAPKKVKELLQSATSSQRASWPVVASGNEIVWMRGFPPAAGFLLKERSAGEGLLIEEVHLTDSG